MERVWKVGFFAPLVLMLLTFFWMDSAFSDVILAPKPDPEVMSGEQADRKLYRESHFGDGQKSADRPADVGPDRSYLVEKEIENHDRKPAGLESGKPDGEKKPEKGIIQRLFGSNEKQIDEEEEEEIHSGPKRPSVFRRISNSVTTTFDRRSPASLTPESSPTRNGIQEVAVIAGDLGFFPKTFFVVRDIPVRLFVTGASKHSLCIMLDSFKVSKQVRSNRVEEISFTPAHPGKYRFYCPVNGMEGTMVVKDLQS